MKVLKIGAEWCSGCVAMKPRWKKIEEQHPWLVTEYYDYDVSKEVVAKYSLESAKLPTFIFLDDRGMEFLRLFGEVSEKDLIKVILENKKR